MSDMIEYILRRLVIGFFVVLAATVLVFGIMQLMPGDPVQLIANPRVSAERIEQLREQWGLNKPVYVQYFYWLSNVLKGNLGTSITTGQSVLTLIKSRLPYTLLLAGSSLILQYIIAVPLGLWAAYRENTLFDNIVVILTIVIWSMPLFWLGVLFIMYFSLKLKLLPVSGYSGFKSLVLPLATATLHYLASTLRLTRSEVLEVLREKYVVTAYSKGLNNKAVLLKHVLRNALIPVTVMFFLSLPWMLGGSVIIERVFSWPGMGQLLWKAISTQDYPIVQGIVLIIAILTVLSNILGDILTALLDPRIRLEIKGERS